MIELLWKKSKRDQKMKHHTSMLNIAHEEDDVSMRGGESVKRHSVEKMHENERIAGKQVNQLRSRLLNKIQVDAKMEMQEQKLEG